MSSKIRELFGLSTQSEQKVDWKKIVQHQHCPYLDRTCLKNRKSRPEIAIGTCSVSYGKENRDVIICPHRLLERRQIFSDCIHLLTLHQPGNQFHIVPELTVPGGSIDYCLASVRGGRVKDFVGVELQTLDTTGTVWPARQRFLKDKGISVSARDTNSPKSFGMNWKMTAKTILVQLHHKVETFEHMSKHLVLVAQDHLIAYMREQFSFDHLQAARIGDPMHFHSYALRESRGAHQIELADRLSTDTNGIAACLGLKANPKVDMEIVVAQIEAKISPKTLLTL